MIVVSCKNASYLGRTNLALTMLGTGAPCAASVRRLLAAFGGKTVGASATLEPPGADPIRWRGGRRLITSGYLLVVIAKQ